MKNSIFTICLLLFSSCIMAQKSQYFTYDRATVNTVMDQINESTDPWESFINVIADTAKTASDSGIEYIFFGCVSSCGGSVIGYSIGSKIGEGAAIPGFIAGALAGIILPAIIEKRKTKDPNNAGRIVLGAFPGIAAGAIFVYFGYIMGSWD